MKTIKIILFTAFLLGAIQSKAANANNDELILQMSGNEQVIQLLKGTYKMVLIRSLDSKLSDKKCREMFVDLCREIKINKESIENTFPAYSAMNTDDKNEILNQVAMKSEKFSSFTTCLWQSVAVYGTCVGGALSSWAFYRYVFCCGVVAVADAAAAVASEGTLAPAVAAAATTEIVACAAATIATVSVAAQTLCAGTLTVEIFACR
jgi:hypothetical protein